MRLRARNCGSGPAVHSPAGDHRWWNSGRGPPVGEHQFLGHFGAAVSFRGHFSAVVELPWSSWCAYFRVIALQCPANRLQCPANRMQRPTNQQQCPANQQQSPRTDCLHDPTVPVTDVSEPSRRLAPLLRSRRQAARLTVPRRRSSAVRISRMIVSGRVDRVTRMYSQPASRNTRSRAMSMSHWRGSAR